MKRVKGSSYINMMFNRFFNNGRTPEPEDSYENIQKFFLEQSKIANTLPIDNIDFNSCAVNSILRPYQRETVQWMIMREMNKTTYLQSKNNLGVSLSLTCSLSVSYTHLTLPTIYSV